MGFCGGCYQGGIQINKYIIYPQLGRSDLETEERAHKGLFLAFQYPIEIPGVNTNNFLKTSLNTIRKSRGLKELDSLQRLADYKFLDIKLHLSTNPLTYLFTHFSYGYIDPRGEVREFTYSSGIACDPLTKQPLDEGSRQKPRRKTGYYDYNSNRFVTADGRRGKLIVNKNNRRRG